MKNNENFSTLKTFYISTAGFYRFIFTSHQIYLIRGFLPRIIYTENDAEWKKEKWSYLSLPQHTNQFFANRVGQLLKYVQFAVRLYSEESPMRSLLFPAIVGKWASRQKLKFVIAKYSLLLHSEICYLLLNLLLASKVCY